MYQRWQPGVAALSMDVPLHEHKPGFYTLPDNRPCARHRHDADLHGRGWQDHWHEAERRADDSTPPALRRLPRMSLRR